MPTTTDIKKLVINVLTEDQYDAAVEEGVVTDDQLSIITDYVDWMQVKQMPTPNYKELGKIYQYIGPTTSEFVHGYFYECKKNSQGWSGELKITTGCVGLSFTFNDDTYIDYFSRLQDPLIAVQSWQYDGHDWIGSYTGPVSKTDLETYGITYTGTPVITDQFRVELSESATYYWEQLDIQPEAELRWGNINGTISNQTDLNNELVNLQDQIDDLKGLGRFLSTWNCETGLPGTNPETSPYVYNSGDYFLVGEVNSTTNYRPSGTQYVIDVPSTVVETEEVHVNDVYIFDGAVWKLQANSQRVYTFSGIAGSPYDNTNLANALDNKVSTTLNADKIYGTDSSGNQTTYDKNSFGQVDDVQVDGVSVVTNKVAEIDLTGKVDKTNEINKLYGTDSSGNQTTYNKDDFYTTIREWVDA